jgi:DNA-binding IclR family transcriptional regulator
VATSDQTAVLSVLSKHEGPVVLEEIAAMSSISFERAWYATLELLEMGLVTPTGLGLYRLIGVAEERSSAA